MHNGLARVQNRGDYHAAMSSINHTPLKRPRMLRAGARIALIAAGGPVTSERIEKACAQCRALGFEPVVAPGAHEKLGYLAGPDERRLADLQSALDDESIGAVWALRGGYGSTRIIERLRIPDAEHPKPFIGFSDNTAIHVALQQHGIVSYHGPHAGGDFPPETEVAFRCVLLNESSAGVLPTRTEDPVPATLRGGSVEAPLFGGNLAMLAALCGTPLTPRARGCLLFLEDVGEPAYRVDRMITQLQQASVLEGVVGLALGRFTECGEEGERSVRDVLVELANRLSVPAVVDFPIGHVEHNWTLPLGCRALLDANRASLQITEPAVSG